MIRKLRKIFPAVVSAVLCVTMVLGIAASAQTAFSRWNECKKLIGSQFNQQYIDLVIKYGEKESKNTVVFSKSRAKKFTDKINKAAMGSGAFSFEISDKNTFEYFAVKGDKEKYVYYEEDDYYSSGCTGEAIYRDGDTVTAVDLLYKTKAVTNDGDMLMDRKGLYTEDGFIDPNQKGKLIKIKSGEKIYYYEEFAFSESYSYSYAGDPIAFLFDEKGNILAIMFDEEAFCVSFKTTVDDSEFEVPKGYETVNADEFGY